MHRISGSKYVVEDIREWLAIEQRIQGRELELHKETCSPETTQEIRRQAVEDIVANCERREQ